MNSKTPENGVATEAAAEPVPTPEQAAVPANEKAPKPAPKKKSKAKTDIGLTELAARYLKHLDTEGKSNGTIMLALQEQKPAE